MAKIRAKLKQLRDADVRYISLVDRAATRIPFRVLKRDKESKMGIDLTGVFKSDSTAKPYVSALVVFSQKNEKAAAQIQKAIKAHGFSTDRVQKADGGETLVYAQSDQPPSGQIVRLSDQTIVSVGNLAQPAGWVGEFVQEYGFLPDLKTAMAALADRLKDIVAKSETPQADAEADLVSYADYLNQMLILPAACYKLDEAIVEIVAKCDPKSEPVVTKGETEEERKKRLKNHPPSEMAPVDEEDDQKPPPDEAMKSDILDALKGIEERTTAQLTTLGTKLETVITDQAEQKKVLDGVVQKTDNLNSTVRATVTAAPVSEDRPASTRMRVQKDDDPRTGTFDTAFLRRRK